VGGSVIVRLFFIQIVEGEDYRQESENQNRHLYNQTFSRGRIFFKDRDGTLISAATLQAGYNLAINPSRIVSPSDTYDKLKELVELNKQDFLTAVKQKDSFYRQLEDHLNEKTAQAIEALELPGVIIVKQQFRAYTGGEMAAHVLGFMGYLGDEYAGRYGLERQYEDVLKRSETPSFSNFLSSLFWAGGHSLENSEAGKQGNIITTIEPNVQNFLENQLLQINDEWHPGLAGGIILDPRTGAVLAMAARPTFNPDESQSDLSLLVNPLVENVYEMGSITKILTVSSGLDAGAVSEDWHFDDTGHLTINNRTISNYDGRGRGPVGVQEIISQSLNTGAVAVMRSLGLDRFKKYFLDFGLAEKTGIDLPGEVGGLLGNLDSGLEIEYATASFGQGIAVTPIGITTALSSLANNGVLVRPQVVKKIEYESGQSKDIPFQNRRRVLKPETVKVMANILVNTVDNVLANGKAKLAHYTIAAKTGTAQIPKAGGGYEESKFLHSFFGYFPASNPRFSVFLYAVEPHGAEYASETLTWPFINLAKFLLNYYQVPPDR